MNSNKMPLTPRTTTISTENKLILVNSSLILWLFVFLMLWAISHAHAEHIGDSEAIINTGSNVPNHDMAEFLHTESELIRLLRLYIANFEEKIDLIKWKTLEIQNIHNLALNDTHTYLNNPINALTIMKRFTSDWNALMRYAENLDNNEGTLATQTESLTFPSEIDYDEAVTNLLRIQDIYKLKPERLAVGEINGIKVGSEMSWSDCLEIGRKSDEKGDYVMAKFWIQAAMEKLPGVNETSTSTTKTSTTATTNQIDKAKFQIQMTLLNIEYHMGNIEKAFDVVNELLQLKPTHKGVLKAKKTLEQKMLKSNARTQNNNEKPLEQEGKGKQKNRNRKLNKNKKAMKNNKMTNKISETKLKSAEELLIEEICRESTAADTNANNNAANTTTATITNTDDNSNGANRNHMRHCSIVHENLPQLLLQPLHIEYFSVDPYVVLHHNVLSAKQINDLKDLIETVEDTETELQFTKMGQRKLKRMVAQTLQRVTGHVCELFNEWHIERWRFDDDFAEEELNFKRATKRGSQIIANIAFNLQKSKLGGSLVFPQLELSIDIPNGALLYWSTLNEYHEDDYRTKQFVCPVIAGTQITAYSSIRYR